MSWPAHHKLLTPAFLVGLSWHGSWTANIQDSFISLRIFASPCPLISAHLVDTTLAGPAELLLSNFSCSPDSLCITTSPVHQLIVALLAAGLLKCLRERGSIKAGLSAQASVRCCSTSGMPPGILDSSMNQAVEKAHQDSKGASM